METNLITVEEAIRKNSINAQMKMYIFDSLPRKSRDRINYANFPIDIFDLATTIKEDLNDQATENDLIEFIDWYVGFWER